ncbi:hypothetical protein KBZ21_40800, partial [Streptomyces sp. A73]|nr:hypothetical protein [Streptomyces sp. A73]
CGASSAHPLALEAGQTLEVAMGTHGPIPKRSEERRRRNKDEGGVRVDAVGPGAGHRTVLRLVGGAG